jgi:hypothetical protein
MKNNILRLLPLWLALLFVMLFAMCGCRTGGSWINPGSAGTIIKGKTPEQMNREAEAKRFQNAQPVQSPQVIFPPARGKPIVPAPQSVEATNVAGTPEAAGEATPFKPTISTEPVKLPPLVKLPPIETKLPTKIVEGGCVVVTDNNGATGKPDGWRCGTEDPEIAGPCEVAPEEQSNSINWVNLFSLFTMLLLGAIGFWVVYDIIKDSIKIKKQGTPIKDHLKNLKKPAKGTRASRKKATTKKKTTRKKKS